MEKQKAANGGSGGPKPRKPKWRTRLGLVAGAVGIACMGLGTGCGIDNNGGNGSSSSGELYNKGFEMGKSRGIVRTLRYRIAKDRARIKALEGKLRGIITDEERCNIEGRISALRNGIDEMNRDILGATAAENARAQAEREALQRPGKE